MVVDGEILDSRRVKYLTKDRVLADHYNVEIMGRDNVIASLNGQVNGLRHELAVAKYQLDKARYDAPQRVVEKDRLIASMTGQIESLRQQAAGKGHSLPNGGGEPVTDAERRLAEVLNSASWRITAPLRYVKDMLARKGLSR